MSKKFISLGSKFPDGPEIVTDTPSRVAAEASSMTEVARLRSELETAQEHVAKLNGIIERLPCLHTHTFEADKCKHKPVRERCANCRAKAEAGVVTHA